ncbi:MAG: DUF4116 domain-containing protein [Paludibacter sp.]
MVQYDLTKKEPNLFDLRAYLFQMLASGFNFSIELLEGLANEFSITGNLDEIDLNLLSRDQIVSFLESRNTLPEYIFFFKRNEEFKLSDYKHYPELFTSIKQISFLENTDDGLVVLEKFSRQIFELYTNNGKGLLDECSDLNLGIDGLIEYRSSDDLSGSWNYERIVEGEFTKTSLKEYLTFPVVHFPNINDRDKIALTNNGIEPKYEEFDLWQGNDYKIAEILEDDGCMIRYMGDLRDNEEFAFIACRKNYLAFTLISKRLKENKSFVLRIIDFTTEDTCIFRFLSPCLQQDEDIFDVILSRSPKSLHSSDFSTYSIEKFINLINLNISVYNHLPSFIQENEDIESAYLKKKKELLGEDGFKQFLVEHNSLPWNKPYN